MIDPETANTSKLAGELPKEELPKEEPIEKLYALHQLKIAGELCANREVRNSRWEPTGEPCVI